MRSWRLTIPAGMYEELHGHLFPGDGDEHGAVIPRGDLRVRSGAQTGGARGASGDGRRGLRAG